MESGTGLFFYMEQAQIQNQTSDQQLSVSHSGQETLLVLLEGGQSGADIQQRGSTLLRAARHQTPVILNPQAGQGLIAHLSTTSNKNKNNNKNNKVGWFY